MSSLAKRTATTLIGVPLVFAWIYFLPHCHRLATAVLVFVACLLGSKEMFELIKKHFGVAPTLPYWLPSLLVFAAWGETWMEGFPLTDFALIILAFLGFGREITHGASTQFKESFKRLCATAFLLIYPNYFFTFLVRISQFEHSVFLLILFFSYVFANDIFAYIFGMWLGGSNKGFLKASPNKSVAGFIGGHVSSILWCIGYTLLFASWLPLWKVVVLGVACTFSANIGDLIESVIKRSVGVKDSGSTIPGRGGILDSTDSLLATAPIFWLGCLLLGIA